MYQSEAMRAVVIEKPQLGRGVDDHDVPVPAERLERLLEPHPVLVLDVVGVEVRIVLVRDRGLELGVQAVRDRVEPAVAGDEPQVSPEPLIGEDVLDFAGGLLREVGVGQGVAALLDEGVLVDAEGVGRVALRVGIDQGDRIPLKGEGRGQADARRWSSRSRPSGWPGSQSGFAVDACAKPSSKFFSRGVSIPLCLHTA